MAAEIYKVEIYRVSVRKTTKVSEHLTWKYNRRADAMDASSNKSISTSKEFLIESVDITEAISKLKSELEVVRELAKAHPALKVDTSAITVNVRSCKNTQYATVFDFSEDENFASYENAYVVVKCGSRGKYISGIVNDLSFEMEDVTAYGNLHNDFQKAACEVVEQYLEDVLDTRYSIFGVE